MVAVAARARAVIVAARAVVVREPVGEKVGAEQRGAAGEVGDAVRRAAAVQRVRDAVREQGEAGRAVARVRGVPAEEDIFSDS